MKKKIFIGDRKISEDSPCFIIAEMSANHMQDYDRAVAILRAAKDAGADAIKLQTYRPDTITMKSDRDEFKIKDGLWAGQTLYELYEKAYTPWDWMGKLKEEADKLGLICFSSPFDLTAVDLMEEIDMPAYKIASYEINDFPLIRKVAKTGKPIIISTGIAHIREIDEALSICKEEGNENVILLKCTSAYPSPYEDINLNTIPTLKNTFDCIMGLSDHTMGDAVAVGGVALGAKVVEKHLTLKRSDGGEDSGFSMEVEEFKKMVDNLRMVEKALGSSAYSLTEKQVQSRKDSRSLYVVEDIKKGEEFTNKNVKSIRPNNGLHTRYYENIIGKKSNRDVEKGQPMKLEFVNEIEL